MIRGGPGADRRHSPVAIGGVGGSGTRVVAEIIKSLGVHIGEDLNESADNLWFTLLFKYREALQLDAAALSDLYRLFRDRMTGGAMPRLAPELQHWLLDAHRAGQHERTWLQDRLRSLSASTMDQPGRPWGWKEPNTHMLIERIAVLEPDLAYVHVARNGLDMALSTNQNQLRLWGPEVLGERYEDSPRGSLAFWCWAHARILRVGEALPGRCYFLNFDLLCHDPEPELCRLLAFLRVEVPETQRRRLAQLVRTPSTAGRHRMDGDRCNFDPRDVDYVRSLGFSVD